MVKFIVVSLHSFKFIIAPFRFSDYNCWSFLIFLTEENRFVFYGKYFFLNVTLYQNINEYDLYNITQKERIST